MYFSWNIIYFDPLVATTGSWNMHVESTETRCWEALIHDCAGKLDFSFLRDCQLKRSSANKKNGFVFDHVWHILFHLLAIKNWAIRWAGINVINISIVL